MRKNTKVCFQTFLFLSLVLFLTSFSAFSQTKPIKDLKQTLILISIDGCRYDYLERYAPPNLNYLARNGVRAKWLIPAFPSKTFPNHYSVATGLYPQNHGIVENNIYDKNFNAIFTLSNREEVQNGRWWLGEPIWVTAEKQKQTAGTFFFPGTEAEIKGVRPTFWKTYDGKIPNEARVDTVLSWLDLPVEKRPTMLTLYFSDVDDIGHAAGPISMETKNTVLKVDGVIGRLIEGLKAREIFNQANIIIVSDHGMAPINYNNAVILDEMFDTNLADKILWTGEIVSIFPREGKEDEIYSALKSKLNPAQANVYRKAELPKRFHYSNSPRIAPLIVLPNEGWITTNRKRFEDMKVRGDMSRLRGNHGYDNALKSMRAIFIAHGKAFKKHKIVEPFEIVNIYNIMTSVLKLKPARNDGNVMVAKKVLK